MGAYTGPLFNVFFHQMIRTGQTLGSALKDDNLKGTIQPFVDGYSNLLQHAVEMVLGPDSFPHHSITDYYPVGSIQPAWVSIFRGGRIHLTTDDRDSARVFLLGYDPKMAYDKNYSIIRHCLSNLVPSDGSNLKVEVFAYENNYKTSELKLNLNPYLFESSEFPSPHGTIPIDIVGLEEFFGKGGQLSGAELNRNNGLILYAKESIGQTLSGHPESLSDFVVA